MQANNIGNMFKYYWLTQARRKIREDGTKAALAAKGIHAVNPQDLITPAYPRMWVCGWMLYLYVIFLCLIYLCVQILLHFSLLFHLLYYIYFICFPSFSFYFISSLERTTCLVLLYSFSCFLVFFLVTCFTSSLERTGGFVVIQFVSPVFYFLFTFFTSPLQRISCLVLLYSFSLFFECFFLVAFFISPLPRIIHRLKLWTVLCVGNWIILSFQDSGSQTLPLSTLFEMLEDITTQRVKNGKE